MKKAIIIVLSLLISSTVYARELVFASSGYSPFLIQDKGNTRVEGGIYRDILSLFTEAYPEYSILYEVYPPKRANIMMARGEGVDLILQSSLFVQEGTQLYYEFSEIVTTTKDIVITKAGSDIDYKNSEDLIGKTVAVRRGYKYGIFDQYEKEGKLRYEVLNEHDHAIKFLSFGRADALLGNIHVHPYYIKKMGLKLSDFSFSEKALFEFDLAFQVRKGIGVLPKLNKFIRKIKNDGTLDKIIDKYIK